MKFSLADMPDGYHISAYDERGVVISGQRYRESLVVLPDRLIAPWSPASFGQLLVEHLEQVLALQPDLVLLGTGQVQRFPAPPLYAAFTRAGVGLEVMGTPAACRTYNILLAEGRRVAAALLLD